MSNSSSFVCFESYCAATSMYWLEGQYETFMFSKKVLRKQNLALENYLIEIKVLQICPEKQDLHGDIFGHFLHRFK